MWQKEISKICVKTLFLTVQTYLVNGRVRYKQVISFATRYLLEKGIIKLMSTQHSQKNDILCSYTKKDKDEFRQFTFYSSLVKVLENDSHNM